MAAKDAKAPDARKTLGARPSTVKGRRAFMLPAALTAAAMCFIAVRFMAAASETLIRTRENACRSLAPDPLPEKLKNSEAPDFDLPDASGHKVSLRSQKGHPVAVNFWATWCPPCVAEVPSLEAFATTLEGTNMRLLAVSVDDRWDQIRRFFVKGTKIPVLLDESHDIPKTFGTTQYPETYFLDSSGRVRYYFANSRDWSKPEAVACLESLP